MLAVAKIVLKVVVIAMMLQLVPNAKLFILFLHLLVSCVHPKFLVVLFVQQHRLAPIVWKAIMRIVAVVVCVESLWKDVRNVQLMEVSVWIVKMDSSYQETCLTTCARTTPP